MYGNIYDDEERFERQAVFPKLLAQHAEDFSWVGLIYGWYTRISLGPRLTPPLRSGIQVYWIVRDSMSGCSNNGTIS